ncbi:MAG TPA: sodium:proton antiporter, partial [Opitutus sp.]|nr:sodium:proton antiporter [Opitutus sp.]
MAQPPMNLPTPFAMTEATDVPLAMVAPFVLLLALIATMPLTPPRIKHWWEHNYPFVALGLAVAVAAYYVFGVPAGTAMLAHTMHEYVSFIVLIG